MVSVGIRPSGPAPQQRPLGSDIAGMCANLTLYVAALHLYGALLEQDQPSEPPGGRWHRLLAASCYLCLLTASSPPSKPFTPARLRELTRATRECLSLLEGADLESAPIRRAWTSLQVVVGELEDELAALTAAIDSKN